MWKWLAGAWGGEREPGERMNGLRARKGEGRVSIPELLSSGVPGCDLKLSPYAKSRERPETKRRDRSLQIER